jgi:hypothetical protein
VALRSKKMRGRFQNSMKLLVDAAVHVLFDCVGWLD